MALLTRMAATTREGIVHFRFPVLCIHLTHLRRKASCLAFAGELELVDPSAKTEAILRLGRTGWDVLATEKSLSAGDVGLGGAPLADALDLDLVADETLASQAGSTGFETGGGRPARPERAESRLVVRLRSSLRLWTRGALTWSMSGEGRCRSEGKAYGGGGAPDCKTSAPHRPGRWGLGAWSAMTDVAVEVNKLAAFSLRTVEGRKRLYNTVYASTPKLSPPSQLVMQANSFLSPECATLSELTRSGPRGGAS
jgi:hypothetical protein